MNSSLNRLIQKRSLRFLLLVLSGTVIISASATIYYTLTMEPQVTVSPLTIRFDSAPDEPEGSTVTDSGCSLTAESHPNATVTYEQAVYIENVDAGSAHSFRLRHFSISPANGSVEVGNWTSIRFLVYNGSGYVFSLNYTVSGTNWILEPSSGETSYYSIPEGTSWWIRLETHSPANATIGRACAIQIWVDVLD